MTRTLNDPASRHERAPAGLGDDPLHHPPKPASMGLDELNRPAGADTGMRGDIDGRMAADQRSIADLVKELRDEGVTLLRQEMALAKTEMGEKARFLGKQVGKVGAGGATLAIGMLMVLGALAYFTAWLYQAIFEALPLAAALGLGFLTVGAVVSLVGYLVYSSAMRRMHSETLAPERTIQSLKEDKQWLTHKTTHPTR
jgi:hypothetical protein